ncbi:MAG: CoA pyrophosphatase [Rhodoferax sp.]|nr:CoA pyrophosphatase [Rhodoferax sp.]
MARPPRLTPLSQLPDFDPRKVPVLAVDTHLPAVDRAVLQPEALERRFRTPPEWQPEIRQEPLWVERPPVPASVLIPVVVHERPTILLTQRTTHLSSHSGQIAFPGGKQDAADADLVATALREAQEEVGLDPARVQVIGRLPEYRTGSGFIITPVVSLVRPGFELVPNPFEVEEAFEVPLDFLMDPANHRRHAFMASGMQREWLSMPYRGEGASERFIWGATAGILRNLYRFLQATTTR